MREARALLLAVAMTIPAAVAMPAKNLGFEAWDGRGAPEGWRVQENAHYDVAPDCAAARDGGCALRIEARPTAARGRFLPLAQPLGAGPAAGHRLKLSGWIRTAGVEDGWAGLWMRADVEGKTMALENMQKEGPRGTVGWSRFTVAIDVPANATLVSFGVLLSGRGTAWFDDLELAVDTSVKVGRALKSEVIFPPRPVPSREHVPDDSLRLPPSETVRVKPEWREAARAAAQPIRSLMSEDFSDLQFLKPLLAGKRVVQLGESAHGVAEFNWLKARLVRFLHREMGFEVVAFESPLFAGELADARIGRSAPIDVMQQAIFPVWHSSETLGLFEYLDKARATPRPLRLAGIDVQGGSGAAAEVAAMLVRQVARVDAPLARRVEAHEARLRAPIDPALVAPMKAAYAEAATRLEAERQALRTLERERPVVVDLAIRVLRSRGAYIDVLAGPASVDASERRDEGMADNLDFLLDVLHPGRKVIVWAHNTHVARAPAASTLQRGMGSWLAARRGAEVYTIGFYMGWGIAARNDRARYEIRRAAEDSLEAILANAGWRLSFVDLSRVTGSWATSRVDAREWGVNPVPIVPAEAFDALIYVDAVTPPEYL